MPAKTKDTNGRMITHWGQQRKRAQATPQVADIDVLPVGQIDGVYWDEPSSRAIFSKVDGTAVVNQATNMRIETHP